MITIDSDDNSSGPILREFNTQDEPKASNITENNNSVSEISTLPTQEDFQFFYDKLLPFRYLFQWLSHSPKPTKDFTMREFAYEHNSGIYQRYNSFASLEEFKKSVVKANPLRFEIGAVYAVNPKERKNLPKLAMKPLSKELVFDIDLTDYDEIRTCCSGTDICKKCWRFIQVASEIIDLALREDFGFKHLLWVFSGRRGAHCWVSDPRARNLDETSRRSIVEYFDVLSSKQMKMGKKSLNLKKPFHPHIERSFNILKQHFTNIILDEQDPWLTQPGDEVGGKNWQQIEELLTFLPEKSLQNELRTKWQNSSRISNSRSKWDDITNVAKKILKNQIQVSQLNDAKKDVIVYYLYPRLDIEVSKQVIHLLKSPFCIHPKTGNICVPFDPKKNLSNDASDDQYGFNPTTVPKINQLITEFDIWDTKRVNRESSQPLGDSDSDSESKRIMDYEKTSLKPYVEHFAKFVSDVLKDELKENKRTREDDPLEF